MKAILGLILATRAFATAPAKLLATTSFFPPEWCGPSGRPPIAFLFIGLAIMALGAFCFAGAIASAETLKKKPWLVSSDNPLERRIGTACGAVVFTVMGGAFVGGWFKLW